MYGRGVSAWFGFLAGIWLAIIVRHDDAQAHKWLLARFGHYVNDAIVLRQSADASPLWICADGNDYGPFNCLSRDDLIRLAREQGRDPE